MLKLVGGHVHKHTPTGIATQTPSREMEEPLRSFDDMQASPRPDAQQGSGSQTYSEGVPAHDWGDSAYALSPVEKRRKMNRESARRTRQRKQELTVSLKAEVATLKTQNVCVTQQLNVLSDKNLELMAERKKLQEQNHMLTKCVAELSTVCKRKEATLEELRHCIQNADKLTDNPLPLLEQGQGQLNSQSLETLCIPNLAQPSSCRPVGNRQQTGGNHGITIADCDPRVNIPAPSTSHVPTPTQMHDSSSGYILPQQQPLMTPLHTNSTFSRTPMMQSSARTTGTASLPASTGTGSMPWIPTLSSSRNAGVSAANSLASNSLPRSHFNMQNALVTSGNRTQPAGNLVQQTRRGQVDAQRCVTGQACMSDFEFGGNAAQDNAVRARHTLIGEVAKQQNGFNSRHVSNIVLMTRQMPQVERTSSDPSFFRPTSRHSETMQEILGRSFAWKANGMQQESLQPSSLPSHSSLAAATTHDPQAALECSQQALDMSIRGFGQAPMQHLDAGGHHNYSMH